MANQNWIVVHDPSGKWWEGSLIEGTRARQLESLGVTLLPVEPRLFRMSGVGGYTRRAWGAGWPMEQGVARAVCPMTMFCVKDFRWMHWVAALRADNALAARLQGGQQAQGFVRLMGDPGQSNPLHVGVSGEGVALAAAIAGPPLPGADWYLVRGRSEVQVPMDGHYAFALYGIGPGVRVAWAAVSLAAE